MPLSIAHGLVGASIVGLICPKSSLKNWKPFLIGFILANIPDLDLIFSHFFGWREFHRGITHSLFFAGLVAVIFFISLRSKNWLIPLAYSTAFLSHTILDFSFAKQGAVRLLIPFDNEPYRLGLISFSEIMNGFNVKDLLYISVIETLIFAPLFLLLIYLKIKIQSEQ